MIANNTMFRCITHSVFFSHKRLTQQKKQRERERKELDALGRRQLANVRVVQRNVVYVMGMGPRFAKEEVRGISLCLEQHQSNARPGPSSSQP